MLREKIALHASASAETSHLKSKYVSYSFHCSSMPTSPCSLLPPRCPHRAKESIISPMGRHGLGGPYITAILVEAPRLFWVELPVGVSWSPLHGAIDREYPFMDEINDIRLCIHLLWCIHSRMRVLGATLWREMLKRNVCTLACCMGAKLPTLPRVAIDTSSRAQFALSSCT